MPDITRNEPTTATIRVADLFLIDEALDNYRSNFGHRESKEELEILERAENVVNRLLDRAEVTVRDALENT